MTGPECFKEAQRLAAESYHEDRFEPADVLLARAQVFATLALAAATAAPFFGDEWAEVTR